MAKRREHAVPYEELVDALIETRHLLLSRYDQMPKEGPAWAAFWEAFRTSAGAIEKLRAAGEIRHARAADGKEETWRWERVPETERSSR